MDIVLDNLIKAYLNRACMVKYALEANYLSPYGYVYVDIDSKDKCYSYQYADYRGILKYSVMLGYNFYPKVRDVNSKYRIPIDKQSHIYSDISLLYDGVFFHELGHILYTPMTLSTEIMNAMVKQNGSHFTEMFGMISNIVEDVVVEGEIRSSRPTSGHAIDHLRKLAFSIAPSTIPSNIEGVVSTLVHNFRTLASSRVAFPDADIHKMITTYMFICINTQEPFLRMQRELAFAAVLWDVFNCKEKPHYTNFRKGLDITFYNKLPDKYKDKASDQKVDSKAATGKGMSSIADSAKGYHTDNEPSNTTTTTSTDGQPVDNPAKDIEEEAKAAASSRGEGFSDHAGSDDAPMRSTDVDEQDVIKLAHNDVVCDRRRHRFESVKGRYDSSPLINRYNDVVNKYSLMISQIAEMIKKRKNWNNTHWEENHMTGKLNDKSFYKRTHKIYKQRTLPKREADLVFSILVDNSGSMSGPKTRICGEALIVLSEVCNKLNIPFEVNAFTEATEAITIGLKAFEDDYNKVKTNLSLIQQQVRVNQLSMFQGNIDEINLEFVWRNFRKRPEKDKILIVISDGETCGSETELKKLAKQIEQDDIQVLGLGIQSDCVDRIYSQHKTFQHDKDLVQLPKFLNDYLVSKIFKQEREVM